MSRLASTLEPLVSRVMGNFEENQCYGRVYMSEMR